MRPLDGGGDSRLAANLNPPNLNPRVPLVPRGSRGSKGRVPSARMAGWKDFREIAAWQRAEQLKLRVYSFLDRPAIRRQFAKFARIAKASQFEVLNHFIDARDQPFLTNDQFLIEEHYVKMALKTTVGLIRHLESSPDPPRPVKKPSSAHEENL